MKTKEATKWILYEPAGSTVTRIIPELASEIGLNESIVLLQISFWLMTSNNARDGKYWTYQSLNEMRNKAFTYWSTDTIRRILHNLRDKGYILIDNFNKRKGDNTQWYAIEPDKCSQLKSVLCANHMPATPHLQVASTPLQPATTPLQDKTTLPEITTENTQKENTSADAQPPVMAKSKAITRKTKYPDDIRKWTYNHISQYHNEHSEEIDLLVLVWDITQTYKSVTEMPKYDAHLYIEAHQELSRLEFAPIEYAPLAKHTRKVRTWADKLVPRDMVREITSYRASIKPKIIYDDPAMDLSIPQPITPILIRERSES